MLSKSDAWLVARDPLIPGLLLLLDDEALRAALAARLSSLILVDLKTDYLRYKPGMSCLARIRLRTQSGEALAYAVAYRRDADNKLLKAKARRCSVVGAPMLCDDAVVYYPFPLDRRLPTLGRLAAPSLLLELLRRLTPGRALSDSVRTVTLRYKPERRYVGQVISAAGPTSVLKIYSAETYQEARLAAKALGGLPGMSSAKCIGHSSRRAALLFNWVEGVPLASLIGTAAASPEMLRQAGRTLGQLHCLETGKLPITTATTRQHHLQELMKDLRSIGDDSHDVVRSLRDGIVRKFSEMPSFPLAPIHGDLHLDQFLVGNDRVELLDFDRASLSDPAEDLGNLYADFSRRLLAGEINAEDVTRLFEEFLVGYESGGGQVNQSRIAVFAAMRLFGTAAEPFRRRRPEWQREMSDLLELAQELVDSPTRFLCRPSHSRSLSSTRNSSSPIPVQDCWQAGEDSNLPSVRRAIDTTAASARLRNFACAEGEHEGVELQSIRVVRHKPGRRCLIEYSGRSRTTGKLISLLGKIHAKQRHDLHFERQHALWHAGFQLNSRDEVSVARPWGVVPEWSMWLQEKVVGQTVWQALLGTGSAAVAKKIAYALAKLHEICMPVNIVHSMDDEIAVLRDRLTRTGLRLPDYASRISRLLDACQRIVADHAPGDACPVHRDFYPDQVLIDGDRLILLDLDLFCHGDAAVDLGNFRSHLIEYSLRRQGHANAYSAADSALVAEYTRLRPSVSAASIDAYTVLSLARHVFLCASLPERKSNVSRVLDACECCIKAGEANHRAKYPS